MLIYALQDWIKYEIHTLNSVSVLVFGKVLQICGVCEKLYLRYKILSFSFLILNFHLKTKCSLGMARKSSHMLNRIMPIKVSKDAKIRNRYNQVPHLTQDTNGKVTNSQLDTTNESQEVSPYPAGDYKTHINRRIQRHSKHKREKT